MANTASNADVPLEPQTPPIIGDEGGSAGKDKDKDKGNSQQVESREPIPTACFSIVVVRNGDKFLVVQETARHNKLWCSPAGRVNFGETFEAAAKRETLEEAGIEINIDGILRIEHSPSRWGARMRVIFVGSPKDPSAPLKDIPDDESLCAKWLSLDQIATLPLRSWDLLEMYKYAASGPPIYPSTLMVYEGTPYFLSEHTERKDPSKYKLTHK